jgi:hypothetical protein
MTPEEAMVEIVEISGSAKCSGVHCINCYANIHSKYRYGIGCVFRPRIIAAFRTSTEQICDAEGIILIRNILLDTECHQDCQGCIFNMNDECYKLTVLNHMTRLGL